MSATERFEKTIVDPKRGRTLIVGSRVFSNREDRRKRYADAVGVDLSEGDGVDVVGDVQDAAILGLGQFAHIECLSVLEHASKPWLMAANLERMLQPGGTLYISAPLTWRIHKYSMDCWRILPDGLRSLFEDIEWDAINIASDYDLWPEDLKKIPCMTDKRQAYLLRTETLGFGRKRL